MSRGSRRVSAAIGALLLVAAGLVTIACDKVPLTAPSGSSVSLSSNTRIVPVNGTADVTATVIESAGTLVQNGTLVTFTTTVGTLEPAEARTHNGSATVRLRAGTRSGRALIRAFSGDAANTGGTDDDTADFFIDIGGAAAGRITLNANPSTVSPNGGTSTLLAVVFDVDGNRLPGVPVSFSTTAGALASSVVTSNDNGEASTTITTNRDAEVTVTVGGASGDDAAVTATVTITAVALPTVGVSVTTATPTVGVPVVFSVTASATAPASIRNATISFGDGSSQTLGSVSSTGTQVSHIYDDDGTYVVEVTVEDTDGARVSQRTSIVVLPSVPVLVTLTATPSTVTTGQVVEFAVTVDAQGGPTAAVQSVTFSFGDGNTSAAAASLRRTHIYGATGSFLATATVRFADGTTRTAQAAVQVN